jgi:cobalamin biosynthesis Mg chelatase CobN
MQKAFTPTWTPLPSEAADDQDGAVASGVADTAVMPTPETESAILIEPAPSEPDAAPPGVVGQTAEEGISAEGGAASEQAAENGVFAAVPGPTGTLSPTQVSVQAYDSAGEAEAPLLAETPTSAPAVEELQESATSTTTLRPSPTATETQIAATATEDKGEKTGSDEAAMRRASEERDRETNDTRWLIAGLGAVLFVASVIVFIVGRRKR